MSDTESKQNYLREQIIDGGLDPNQFIDYLRSKREDGNLIIQIILKDNKLCLNSILYSKNIILYLKFPLT